jgi:hypothetical protein
MEEAHVIAVFVDRQFIGAVSSGTDAIMMFTEKDGVEIDPGQRIDEEEFERALNDERERVSIEDFARELGEELSREDGREQ